MTEREKNIFRILEERRTQALIDADDYAISLDNQMKVGVPGLTRLSYYEGMIAGLDLAITLIGNL